MRIAYLGPAGTFTEDALGEAIGGADFEPLRTDDRLRGDPRGDRGARPTERWCRSRTRSRARSAGPSTSSPSSAERRAIIGEHDYPVRHHLIVREGVELGQIEAVLSHPQALAQTARFLRENLPGVELRASARPRRRCGWSPSRRGPGRRSARARRRCSTAARSCARGSRTRPKTSPASSGWRRRGPSRGRGRRRAVEDLADLLRARRGPPGRAGRRARRVLLARHQHLPDRVAAAALRTGPLHVLRRPRREARRRAGCGGDRALRAKAESVRILGSYPVV